MKTLPANKTSFGRGLWNIWVWIAAGLGFWVLSFANSTGPRSPFWPAELLLYTLMIGGMWAGARGRPIWTIIRLPRSVAPAAYVFLVWLFGMMFELSLTITGEGVGGLHPESLPSFILAQGDYIPIALVSYFVVRRFHAAFTEVFFLAGGKSLTEGIVFTGVLVSLIASPMFFLAPLAVAYYTLVYASFIASPLLFIDPELLWDTSLQPKPRSTPFYWMLGFVLAMIIRLFWGFVYGPMVTQLFDLPPFP